MAKTQTKTQGIALEKVGDAGDFSGYAATWSNVDHQGDRIVKGAFTATLPSFRSQRGVICWQHDQSRPVAYVVEILEDDVGLFVAAKFHSVPSAQEARTIVLERAAIGLPHGLSIGFGIAPGGSRFVGNVRELLKLDLLEVSLVAIPANERALVTAAKARGIDPEELALRIEALRLKTFMYLQNNE